MSQRAVATPTEVVVAMSARTVKHRMYTRLEAISQIVLYPSFLETKTVQSTSPVCIEDVSACMSVNTTPAVYLRLDKL